MLGARRLLAEQAEHELGRALEEPDRAAPKTVKKPRTGAESDERGPLGMAERDPLRHELADHDVEVGDDEAARG